MRAAFGWARVTAALPVAVATLMSGIFQPIVGAKPHWRSSTYDGVFLAAIGLLLLASAVGWAVQELRYSLKYQTVVAAATRSVKRGC